MRARSRVGGLRIAELVRRAGVTRATVHHYVKEGLLPEPKKTAKNMALYDPDCVERITLIRGLQRTYRRSLAEVRDLLASTDGHDGLRRLKERVESEPSEVFEVRARSSESVDSVARRTGLDRAAIDEIASLGIVHPEQDELSPVDVDVLEALLRLREAGFGEELGFSPRDVLLYVDAMRSLLHREVELLLSRTSPGESPTALLERAEVGIERVTPLLLAIRRKLMAELLNALPLPRR